MHPPRSPERVYGEGLTDSRRWDAYAPRPGDIVVNTPPKSGTTWTQSILAMLIACDPEVDADTAFKSPWIDIAVRDIEEVTGRLAAQDHRRQVKSHTPFDGIPVWPEMRYISVYRHPIDVHFSYRRHTANMGLDLLAEFFPEDIEDSFALFLEGQHQDAASLWAIIHHYHCTMAMKDAENVLILHYADMLRDLPSAVEKIAAHVGIHHPPDLIADIVEAATFDSMKKNAHRFTPSAGRGFWRDDAGFFDSASSNKWVGKLSEASLEAYDARMTEMLSQDDRVWLEWGRTPP